MCTFANEKKKENQLIRPQFYFFSIIYYLLHDTILLPPLQTVTRNCIIHHISPYFHPPSTLLYNDSQQPRAPITTTNTLI